jgi:hypothetical protein
MKCNIMQYYAALVYSTSRSAIFPNKGFANHLMTALLLATDEVHTQPVSVKHFCLNSLTAKSVLAGEKLKATYSIST